MNKKTIITIILCASLVANGVFVYMLQKDSKISEEHQINQKVLDFRNMFTEKVLLSNQEIDFNTRLSLETAVRSLNDPEIFNLWEAFVNSKDQVDATSQAKNLLRLLIKKTS